MIYIADFLPSMIDGAGAYGGILSYGLTIAVVGSALLIFIRLWFTGKLDLDEEPKIQMMLQDRDLDRNIDRDSNNNKENNHDS